MLLERFQACLSPQRQLSLDESLLLHRGRLSFRTYMKGKKSKYGIKLYELTTFDGFVLNIEIYAGKQEEVKDSKIADLVLRLMRPYLNKGHTLYMDNYYNSFLLSKQLLQYKTHTSGTLRRTRKNNPKFVTSKKLKKGEYIWQRAGKVYVSKWRDKREVLCITTANHPEMVETRNKRGQLKMKPKEIEQYNKYMSGIDRCDQMVSYYSSPRKTIKWNKKIMFHLLDISVWNAYYMYKQKCKKISFLQFRNELILKLLGNENDFTVNKLISKFSRTRFNVVSQNRKTNVTSDEENKNNTEENLQHFPEKIPIPPAFKRKTYFLRCRLCTKNNNRKETSYRCKGCPNKPPLCPECFEDWHKNV